MPNSDSSSEERSKKPTTHDERNAVDLEKMAGDFEETEITAGMADALKKVTEEKPTVAPVPKIKIKPEDVDLIATIVYAELIVGQEFEISRIAAEKKLKECHGNVREALCALCK